ncbi:MAG TPA: hypothetical protein VK021_13010 [Flavobacteriaceae bacterium]|nr:hypothetical protein [Flavobacteriaceae bacterium]
MKTLNLNREELADYILNTAEESVLEKINRIIQKENNIIAYTAEGEPLTEKTYKTHINKISESVTDGAQTYSTEEVKNYVLNRNK